jgi:protein TonB
MSKSQHVCWEETVFEHRNKEYGAFLLRFQYPYHLTVSALIVIALFVSVMTGFQIIRDKKEAARQTKKVRIINYSELSAPPPIEKVYIPPPPEPEVEEKVVVKAKVEKYVAPVVVEEEVVEPEEEMMTMEEVKQDLASTDNTIEASDGDDTIVALPVYQEPVEISDVSRNPEFPGGLPALNAWLESNIKYPSAAKRMGIEGKVVVAFTVDENGKVSDMSIVESLHRLCDREAIRLVKAMPDWIPGERNGIKSCVECSITVPFDLATGA